MPVDLIAVDWGSSQLRVTALDVRGAAIDASSSADGVLLVPREQQASRLLDVLAPFRHRWPDVPIVAAGMIGSRNGLAETTPVCVPAGPDTIAAGVEAVAVGDAIVHVLPGLVDESANPPDLIRGEEAQVLGWLAARETVSNRAAPEAVVIVPGTHSKWVRVTDGGIGHFRTFLTGELYAQIRDMSSLRGGAAAHRTVAHRGGSGERTACDVGVRVTSDHVANRWFHEGVELGLAGPGLLHTLFGVRSRRLSVEGELDVGEYLSGLLIGSEIAEARERHLDPANGQMVLISDQQLGIRYRAALDKAGMAVEVVDADVFGVGARATYRRYTEQKNWRSSRA